MKFPGRKWLRDRLLLRVIRHRDDNAVWFWQQRRIRRAVEAAFAASGPLRLDSELSLGGTWPDAQDPMPVLLAACDEAYFDRFGRFLALSSASRSPGTRVHLHIYEPSPDCIARAEALMKRCSGRLTISHEPPGRNPFGDPIRFYFAAARFAIASRMRRTIAAPIMMVDADGLVVRELTPGFAGFEDADAGFILSPENVAPYRKILASAIYLGATAKAEDFFTRLADGIGLALREAGPYHVDQIGIHYALQWCAANDASPRIQNVDMKWSDSDFASDALIWSTRGPRKARFDELLKSFEEVGRDG